MMYLLFWIAVLAVAFATQFLLISFMRNREERRRAKTGNRWSSPQW